GQAEDGVRPHRPGVVEAHATQFGLIDKLAGAGDKHLDARQLARCDVAALEERAELLQPLTRHADARRIRQRRDAARRLAPALHQARLRQFWSPDTGALTAIRPTGRINIPPVGSSISGASRHFRTKAQSL